MSTERDQAIPISPPSMNSVISQLRNKKIERSLEENEFLTPEQLFGDQPQAPLVSPSSRLDDEEEEEKLARRQAILDICHKRAWTVNPATRERFSYEMRCGHWRKEEGMEHCLYCLADREKAFQERGELCRDYLKEDLGILRMDDKKFKKLARKFRKNFIGYWRIPINDSEVIVLFDASTCPELSALSYDDLNWHELCQTPRHKQYSGSLGYIKKEEKEKFDDDIIVEVPSFVPDSFLTSSEISSCWEEVLRCTDHQHPAFDKDKIQYACFERMDLFMDEIERAGGAILYKNTRRVRVSSKSYSSNIDPDKEVTKENLKKRAEQRVLDFDQAVGELFLL